MNSQKEVLAAVAKAAVEAGFEKAKLEDISGHRFVTLVNYRPDDRKKPPTIISSALTVLKKAKLKQLTLLRELVAVDGRSVIVEVELPEVKSEDKQ